MRRGADGIVLTKEEYLLLAASEGVETLFGVFPEEEQASDEEILQKLFALIKDGVMRVTADGVEATEELKQIFSVIRDCSCVLTVYVRNAEEQPICFYLSDGSVVCVRESGFEAERLHLSRPDSGRVWDVIEESVHLPVSSLPDELLREQDETEETEIQFRPVEELLRTEQTLFVMDLVDISLQKTRMRLLVIEEELYPRMVLQTNSLQESTCCISQAKKWTERILAAGMSAHSGTENFRESAEE